MAWHAWVGRYLHTNEGRCNLEGATSGRLCLIDSFAKGDVIMDLADFSMYGGALQSRITGPLLWVHKYFIV